MTLFTKSVLVSCFLVASTPVLAQVDPNAGAAVPTSIPAAQISGDVTYITGGIGDEERQALQNVKTDYNLYITNSSPDGAFSGNSQIIITNSSGTKVLEATSGPIFYAKLPAGTYTVTSQMREQTKTHNITVGSTTHENIEWRWGA